MAPRMRLDLLVNDFAYRAYYDRFIVLFEAHFKRNYIHVRDVANAFLHAHRPTSTTMKGEAVQSSGCPDANLSKWELCERIQQQLPKFVVRRIAGRRKTRTSATTSSPTRRSSAPASSRASRSTPASRSW